MDITESTRPGMQTVFASSDDPITIPMDQNQENSSEILLYPGALTFSSPESGSWVWARSTNLNYTGSWDLASLDPGIEEAFQTAIFDTQPGSLSSTVHRQMQSPSDGKLKIRITYDWERLEAPTVMTSLYDRPNDGGGFCMHPGCLLRTLHGTPTGCIFGTPLTIQTGIQPRTTSTDLPHTRESRTGLRLPPCSKQATAMALRYRYQTRGSTGPQ